MTMTFLFFIGALYFLFSGAFAASLWTNEKPERLFLPILLGNTLLLYLGVSLHQSDLFFYVIYAGNVLALPVTVAIKRRCGEKVAWRALFTPGVVFLLVGLTAVCWLNFHCGFYWWDVISHWGTYAKLLFLDGKLSCEYPPEVLLHASYPPGQGVLSLLVHKCFFGMPFQERIVIFAHELITWGVLSRVFSSASWYDGKKIVLLAILLAVLMIPAPFLYVYTCGYCDCALAMLFALTTYEVIALPFDKPRRWLELAVLTAFLFMVRNAGWGYAVGLLILYAIRLAGNFRAATDRAARKLAVGAMFLLPVAVKLSWGWQLKIYHTVLRFGGDHITWSAVHDFIANRTEDFLFSLSCFGEQLSRGYWEFLLLAFLLIWWLARRSGDREKRQIARSIILFYAIAFLLFCATLFIYYQFEFVKDPNADRFPSFCRYCSTFLYSIGATALLFLSDMPAKTTSSAKLPAWLGVTATAVFLGVFLPIGSFHCDNCAKWRRECEKINQFSALLTAPGKHFTSIGTSGVGFKPLCFTYLEPHHHRLIMELYHTDALRPMPTATIRELLLKNQIDFVYFTDTQPEFYRMHPDLFVTPNRAAQGETLFQVTPDGNLQYVGSAALP